jgi:hypothetical protein
MSTKKENKPRDKGKKENILRPDPATLHTTDPQEKMEGPVSSVVQNIKEEAEEDDSKKKEDGKK